MIRVSLLIIFKFLLLTNLLQSQECVADAGNDIQICDGDGSSSNYTYLNGGGSSVIEGDVNFEWTVLTVVGNGDDSQTLVISNSESDELDPRFKYPDELSEDTNFLVQLRIYDDAETCEDYDTVEVFIQSNMCPRAFAGDDQTLSNGCDLVGFLDGSESEDPQGESLSYQWSSIDGFDATHFSSPNSPATEFQFPETSADQMFSFRLVVSDAIRSVSDTVRINYLDNDAPNANAGADFTTCDYQFSLNGSLSYDVNYNALSYTWTSLEGLEISEGSSNSPKITSPLDLNQDTEFTFTLEVNDGFCSTYDEVKVIIAENICPVADGGGTKRVPKYERASNIVLNGSKSFDPDGNELSFEWISPDGSITQDSILTVSDSDPNSRFSENTYVLKVMDSQNSVATDSVNVIFSYFSAPVSPSVYAVASHARVLVSWDAASEASYDSLSGYADFEGYKLYRSTDQGETWGGDEDKLYDFNGKFVGWKPYAQFDLNEEEDVNHCIYNHEYDCEPEDARQTVISGLDPLAPRFSLGINTGIEYSFVDSNVVDGVEYTYTVTAYDIGLAPFSMDYSEVDSSGIYVSDTVWSLLNPGKFLGPDTLNYYDESGSLIRRDANPNRGFPSLESKKGINGDDHNFITVIPGYTALDVSFPDPDEIDALFTSNLNNIGTGDKEYFIVDRNEIVRDYIKYEIQATQKSSAVDGMACEDPYIFGYVTDSTYNTPERTTTFYENNLNFFEKDSISGLPGVVSENGSYIVPIYDIITPLDRWSNQFKGIRFKIKNKIPLNPSAVPDVSIDTLIWNLPDFLTPQEDSLITFALSSQIFPVMSYTNIASYLRRLNFDYKIQFFQEPVGDTVLINNASGEGYMYFPFRIINMWTGKKVGLYCNDFGSEDASPVDFNNGAADYVWTSGEDIFLARDTLKIAGTWSEKHNYNLDLFYQWPSRLKSKFEFDGQKAYEQGDTIFFKNTLWVASIPSENGLEPQSIFVDENDDGERNNPWRQIYPWSLVSEDGQTFENEAIELVVKPNKLFVDGDSWFSDMSKLGEKVGISDTLCLDSIKVVPNPYKANSDFNETPNNRRIRFTHLPTSCQISIYTISGEHVKTFQHDAKFDGNAWWDLTNGHNQMVAPGLYIYVIEFPNEQDYCLDTYDDSEDRRGSKKNDYYSNNKYDNKRVIERTNTHIGKFAVIR